MSKRRVSRASSRGEPVRVIRIRPENIFHFTPAEFQAMRRTLCQVMMQVTSERAHRHNEHIIRRQLAKVRRGLVPKNPREMVHLAYTYQAAGAAYDTARQSGKTEEEARKSAVLYACLSIERWLGFSKDALANLLAGWGGYLDELDNDESDWVGRARMENMKKGH